MEIRRFFVDKGTYNKGDEIVLTGDEFLHMTKVLRYKVGFKAIVLANDGVERLCTVESIDRDCARLRVEECTPVDRKHVRLTLYAAILKNSKLDLVIQKSVELGVDRIIPFVSANCAEDKFSAQRANRIALEAAKQCGSVYLSEVCDPVSFKEVVEAAPLYDAMYFANEREREQGLLHAVKKQENVALVVGPEGGFEPAEADALVLSGAKSISLGRRILRAETASVVGVALLLGGMGELDYD